MTEPGAAPGAMLLTVFLKHRQSMNLAEINQKLESTGFWKKFRAVHLPFLVGPLTVAIVLRTIEAFKVFDIIWVMTRGGPANSTKSLSIVVYQEAFSFQRAGSGASIALIVALISAVLTTVYVTAMRRQAEVR